MLKSGICNAQNGKTRKFVILERSRGSSRCYNPPVSVITAPRRLIRIAELSKAREGNPVLDRLGLEISAGKSCGIIAEDRDALATLIDIVSGAEAEDSGFMAFDVHAGAGANAGRKERLARVGVARERPHLVEKMSVLDNIYLGSIRKYRRFWLLDESLMRRKAESYLRLLDARLLLDAPSIGLQGSSWTSPGSWLRVATS
jgi:ABC-type sugar transport system ATPase subunit